MSYPPDAKAQFYPYQRTERYPRYLYTDFRKLKGETLKKYLDTFEVPVAPKSDGNSLAVAAGRHFDALLDVDEDDVLGRFMNCVRKIAPALAPAAADTAVGKRNASKKVAGDDMLDPDDTNLDEPGPGTRGRARTAPNEDDRRGGAGAGYDYGRGGAAKRGRAGGAGAMHAPPPAHLQHPHQMAIEQDMEQGGPEELYCVCQRPAFGEMIGCDNSDCPYEWFHVECVGLDPKNKPKGKWFCPPCRGLTPSAFYGGQPQGGWGPGMMPGQGGPMPTYMPGGPMPGRPMGPPVGGMARPSMGGPGGQGQPMGMPQWRPASMPPGPGGGGAYQGGPGQGQGVKRNAVGAMKKPPPTGSIRSSAIPDMGHGGGRGPSGPGGALSGPQPGMRGPPQGGWVQTMAPPGMQQHGRAMMPQGYAQGGMGGPGPRQAFPGQGMPMGMQGPRGAGGAKMQQR